MKRVLCLAILLCSPALVAQASPPAEKPQSASTQAAPPPSAGPKGFVLEDATPVKLRINRTVSSANAKEGDTIDFEVLEDVQVNGVLVVPKGGLAFATVTEAQNKRRMGRGGKLEINIDYVRLLDNEKAPLRAVKEVKGGGHTAAMTGGIVATSLVFFPAAPFFLFMHGKDITIPKGTEITAYVSGDMKLDPAKFNLAKAPTPPPANSATGSAPSAPAGPATDHGAAAPATAPADHAGTDAAPPATDHPTAGATTSATDRPSDATPPASHPEMETRPAEPSSPATPSGAQVQLQIASTPAGADIEIDGSFVGSTPSTVGVPSGQHQLSVKKPGFKTWERKITVSSGQVTVNATLESEQK
jgi:hypothetical protein